MPLEIERKFLDVDFDGLRQKLDCFGAVSSGPHFETNLLMDTVESSLYAHDELLRLRRQEWPGKTVCRLTFKKPPRKTADDACAFDAGDGPNETSSRNFCLNKRREELETIVEDMDICQAILENLGFRPWARYEKIRESYSLDLSKNAENDMNCKKIKIELDYLCFCRVVEAEGSAELIDEAAALLGLDKFKISITNYHKLHQEWRRKNGLPLERDFVFDPLERRRLRKELGLN